MIPVRPLRTWRVSESFLAYSSNRSPRTSASGQKQPFELASIGAAFLPAPIKFARDVLDRD